MNFIQLVQAVSRRVGLQGTGPSSVDVSGYESQIVAAVQDAWIDIQNYRPKWKWMRASVNFSMTIGKTEYSLMDIFGPSYRHKLWLKDTFLITINGKKVPLVYVDYDVFILRHANATTNSRVSEFTIKPSDDSLVFTPPDSTYSIDCDYQKSPQELTNNTDTPELPEEHHRLIVYSALENYGAAISFADINSFNAIKYVKALGDLLRCQNPREKLKVKGIV